MPDRADIVRCARSWVGVRYRHHGRSRERGVDCIGLVVCVARELGGLGDYEKLDYSHVPDPDHMGTELAAGMDEIFVSTMRPGDVPWFRIGRHPRHVGIIVPYHLGGLGLIHAFDLFGKVAEHRLDSKWRRRVHRAFSYRGVTG